MTEKKLLLGEPVDNWVVPVGPVRESLHGRFCVLEPLDLAAHAKALFDAYAQDVTGQNWTYLPYGPFASFSEFEVWLQRQSSQFDPLFFAIRVPASHRVLGMASFMRVQAAAGSIEIGHINFSPDLQRTTAATEALHLMIEHAFSLGYRRCEWKCNALNQASRRAAQRLGFSYEGTFRQSAVIKGRNRDTAWFSILDSEWPSLKRAHRLWLQADNFSEHGQQNASLSALCTHARTELPQ